MPNDNGAFTTRSACGELWTVMPPRSVLYNLEPYAGPEAQREGIISYIIRLAHAHSLNPRHLVKHVFVRAEESLTQICDHTFFAKSIGTAHGLGKYARLLSGATNALTGRQDLAGLTMLHWSEMIPEQSENLLASHPRWCPFCFAEQIESLGETYSPLAWSLSLYRNCVHHSCQLLERCFQCGRTQDFLPAYPDVARCGHCGKSLIEVLPSPSWTTDTATSETSKRRIEEIIAEMLERHEEVSTTVCRDHFKANIRRLVQSTCGGNQAAFCRLMGWDMWALNGWLKRDERISLPKLLHLSRRFSASPIDLCGFHFECAALSCEITSKACAEEFGARARKPAISKSDLMRIAKNIREKVEAEGHSLRFAILAGYSA